MRDDDTPCTDTRTIRRSAEAAIEHLIMLVDTIDGDTDREENGDLEDAGDAEPSLAATENHPHCVPGSSWRDGPPCRDRDGSQVRWALGSRDDREGEHDGCEGDVDDELSGDENEPSLGAFDRLANQDHAWRQTEGRNWTAHLNGDHEAEPPMT